MTEKINAPLGILPSMRERALRQVGVTKALKEGGGWFDLSSGFQSHWFFDGQRYMSHAPAMQTVGATLGFLCRSWEVEHIGGPAMGAIYLAQAALYDGRYEDPPLTSFSVRNKPGPKNGADWKPRVEGVLPTGRTLVVDDVCTTGKSLQLAINKVEELGGTVVKVVVLVDRMFTLAQGLRAAYGLEGLIPVEWLFPGREVPV